MRMSAARSWSSVASVGTAAVLASAGRDVRERLPQRAVARTGNATRPDPPVEGLAQEVDGELLDAQQHHPVDVRGGADSGMPPRRTVQRETCESPG